MPVREFARCRRLFALKCCNHGRRSPFSTNVNVEGPQARGDTVTVDGKSYETDDQTNVTSRILGHTERKLHLQKCHPIQLLKRRIADFFTKNYVNRRGNPNFSVYDRLSPVVTLEQNFDSLLVPKSHPSRCKSDSYYVNGSHMLRAHTSAHQVDLVKSGLDAFLVAGDVYRRDQIDRHHYPVFHQMEGVRLFSADQLFEGRAAARDGLELFEDGSRDEIKQGLHTMETAKLLEHSLKTCLQGLAKQLFGPETETRWVPTTFPFTHPSWELEARFQGDWLELLGCGIMEQEILYNGLEQPPALPGRHVFLGSDRFYAQRLLRPGALRGGRPGGASGARGRVHTPQDATHQPLLQSCVQAHGARHDAGRGQCHPSGGGEEGRGTTGG
ncbi:phenylalanine--tRNA ligase, mitochondrial isoform X2 [Ixodes scapularis]|uniref:phenylalanine--tRNA ligase, mitochondrial isoform X2 n=1 Tax=Ixodes scapularis TaxID=6945 RepID=UPI001C38B335|nr:phenylalanine--tRNA ligase, mitochondrial isoform X2 [Ixodes scapularis]